jgi:hypothetical protein
VIFALWQFFPNYACIVLSNDGLHIVHATIADLNCVSVENFVKFVLRRKIFVNQAEKIASMLILTLLLKGGLNQMMLHCPFLRGCCGVSFM